MIASAFEAPTMSIDRFFRRPVTSDEWRSRARAIQSQLEGLSIDELLRGATKRGEPTGRGTHEYDPNQPRVPAGHSDGGQWTSTGAGSVRIDDPRPPSDEEEDDYWLPSADFAARGHHWMPRQYYLRFQFTRETRKVFREATSGTLPHRIYSEDRLAALRHRFDHAHRRYNNAVYELIKDYMSELQITPQQMTPDHARKFLQIVHESNDIRIRQYNGMIKFMHQMYRLRSGWRGNE
jgi:hypothetical protein